MLSSLNFTVTFSSTGLTLSQALNFKTGLTAITGPNECGKSTVLEMIRYALFGPAALRAGLDTYAKLYAELVFKVKDQTYRIVRSLTTVKLFRGDELIATGAKAVNKSVEGIFGYGLAVFDIAHVANQNQVEALSNMLPTARKAMVDKVIGMDQLDAAASGIGLEVTSANATVKGLELALGPAPTPPQLPSQFGWEDRYMLEHGVDLHSTAIGQRLGQLEPKVAELQQARAWLSANPLGPEPQSPAEPCPETAEALRASENARDGLVARREALSQKLAGLAPATATEGELLALEASWPAYEAWTLQVAFVARYGAQPDACWTVGNLDNTIALHAICDRKEHLEGEVEARLQGLVKCPGCGTEFDLDSDKLKALETELHSLLGLERPKWSVQELKDLKARVVAWAGRNLVPEVSKPALNLIEIGVQRQALALALVFAERDALVVPPSRAQDLRARESYELQLANFDTLHASWAAKVSEVTSYTETVIRLTPLEPELLKCRSDFQLAREYEIRMEEYKKASDRYESLLVDVEVARHDADQWKLAGDTIRLLRTKVKTFLVPSLNAAASRLLAQMTGGVRNKVQVSDSFEEMLIDGQPIETLSGSGRAVANLAIRLGLGQVLTNRTFSVFMGDEIDASMDADRTGYVAVCFEGLGSVIKQVILVSHKELDVQHNIRLGQTV